MICGLLFDWRTWVAHENKDAVELFPAELEDGIDYALIRIVCSMKEWYVVQRLYDGNHVA